MDYFIRTVLPAIIVIVVGVISERIISVLLSRYSRNKELSQSHTHLVKMVFRWLAVLVVVIIVASIFGIGIGNLWATITAVAAMVIIGFFAIWSVLSNILATVVVLLAKPFSIGDRVTILPENLTGQVIDINLLYTKLKTSDGEVLTVPNISFLTKFVSIAPAAK